MTDKVSVSFQPSTDNGTTAIEDVLNTIQKVSTPQNKLIVVFDEFQSILEIDKNMDKLLRSIMQEQTGINYIFLGSQESMMTDIFERVKSPFYHFGMLMRLNKIPYYPGHLASAVCFNQQVTGDYILLNGSKFVVCDPTYIGAPVGLTMPNMDNKSANVIILE